MNKVPSHAVIAPCANASFEDASGNSTPASPKSADAESFRKMSVNDIDELRCDESIGSEKFNLVADSEWGDEETQTNLEILHRNYAPKKYKPTKDLDGFKMQRKESEVILPFQVLMETSFIDEPESLRVTKSPFK